MGGIIARKANLYDQHLALAALARAKNNMRRPLRWEVHAAQQVLKPRVGAERI